MTTRRLLTVKELCEETGLPPSTIYESARVPGCPVYRFGAGRGTLRFDLDEYLAWARERAKRQQIRHVINLPSDRPRKPKATRRLIEIPRHDEQGGVAG